MTEKDDEQLMIRDDHMVQNRLREIGIKVSSVYDLVNSTGSYTKAIPILASLLPEVSHDRIKEGLARALTVKSARPLAAGPLLREFLTVPSATESQQHTKWAIGNALAVTADDSLFDALAKVVMSHEHGWTRGMLPLAFTNMPKHRQHAIHLLRSALKDKDIQGQALVALGKLNASEARKDIEAFLGHSDPWLRKEAKKAMKSIDKA